MSTRVEGSPPPAPEPPSGEIVVRPPPVLEDHDASGGVLAQVIPMLGSLGSVAVVATMGSASSAGRERSLWAAGMFLVATLGFVMVQLDRQRVSRLRRTDRARTSYLRHLGRVRVAVRDAAAQQRAALLWQHPEPGALPSLVEEGSRVWERAVGHPEFLCVRYGVGSRPLAVDLVEPTTVEEADPVAASALRRLLTVHRMQTALPATLDLRAENLIEIRGSPEQARSLARAVTCTASTFHSPTDLAVAVLAGPEALAEWDWVKWLPHARSSQVADAVGPRRMVAADLRDLESLLPPGGHLLIVVDGCRVPARPLAGRPQVTVLDLSTSRSEAHGTCLTLPDDALDACDLATAEAVARRLAPRRAAAGTCPQPADDDAGPDAMGLFGLPDLRRYDPGSAWRPRPERDRLRVAIGRDDGGGPVSLDLKEAAEHGMGPHGLLVGATGSGKSELLRTLVLGLAATHSPAQLNLVLVDFKGGATFAGMAAMPHVSALITNLADDLALVDRMHDALSGELVRRQEVLRAAGGFASVRDYEAARAAGAALDALPSLLVVVDEFSELLSARPELVDLFVAIGRLGRSLGLHLLLASQRLEEGRLRGLESHLSYRIALRTFSAQESRTVLGVPDAHELPPVPGLAYLQADRSTLLRFETAYVSGPSLSPRIREADPPQEILPWTITEVRLPRPVPPPAPDREPESLLTAAVARMHGFGPQAHRIWLPPLDLPETLDGLMPDLAADPVLGLVSHRWRARGGLVAPIGVVDRPREQRRDPFLVDLSGSAGHVAVVGGPRSGRSTLLRTLVTSLSLTTTPAESQFFVLDLGGGAFQPMSRLPHLAGLATRSEPDVVRRVVAEVYGIIERREIYFHAHGIDSIDTYRGRRARGLADDGYGEVFLVVDGWASLRAEYDDLEEQVHRLAARGLTYGCHVLASASRWGDVRAPVRDLFGTRLELRLGDPTDSEVDRRSAALVPPERPGRGLTRDRLHVLTALPRIDGDRDDGSLGTGLADLAAQVGAAWRGPPGPKLRLLPERVPVDDLLERAGPEVMSERRLLLGVDERDLAPVGTRRRDRAALAGLRRCAFGQDLGAAHLRPRGDAHPQPA